MNLFTFYRDLRDTTSLEMSPNLVEDPLFYGTISRERKDIPTLKSGQKILSELDHLMEKDQPLSTPLRGQILNTTGLQKWSLTHQNQVHMT